MYRVAGGRGFEGEKREGHKSYLWRGFGLADVDRGGLAAERGGRRRTEPAAAVVRWSGAATSGSRSTSGKQGS